MVKNGIKNKRLYRFIIIWLVLFVGVSVLVFTNTKTPLKAETSYYVDLSSNYIIDYSNAPNYSNNNDTFTMTNNYDGTFTFNGTTSAVRYITIPLSEKVINLNWLYATIVVGYSNYPSNGTSNSNYNWPVLNSWGVDIYTSDGYILCSKVGNPNQTSYKWGIGGKWFHTSFTEGTTDYTNKWQDANITKYIRYRIPSNYTADNIILCPIIMHNLANEPSSGDGSTSANQISNYNYFLGIAGPKQNDDVYYALTKPQAGYYIYQKTNAQLGVDLLPAIRYTLTADTTEITKDSALTLEPGNIDVLKLTAPNGNVYRVYYDNITSSNTKDSYFVDDNGTTTILQNADGSGLVNSTGLDALILAFQHALTYNSVITTADHYIFNLCSYLYVFDTDFGYAKGVQEGSANYQPGQPGYTSIYNAGKNYGEQQKDLYYGEYYGGSNGVGGAGYTSIYNAGVEAGADISVNWVFKCMSAVGSFLAIEILPNITFGALIGIPFIITLAWFIIRQLRGGGGS